jgi:isopentenyl diphosphate isomerase/L-lactate dehydrogenase-like FMN-dependent dehydrogenase
VNPRRALSIADLRRVARRRLPRLVRDYVEGGVEDEAGVARNRLAFAALGLVPRYLVDVSARDRRATLFGRAYAAPFGLAPVGLANLSRPGADAMMARAAAAADVPMVLSTAATTRLEEIAAAAPGHAWFQLYAPRDRRIAEDLVRRARAAGMNALVVTVDVPVPAKRERDARNGFALPLRLSPATLADMALHPAWALAMARHGQPRFENLAPYAPPRASAQSLAAFMASQISPALAWADLAWIRAAWGDRPLIVKGILAVDDARRAVEAGADGIVVSNHGGRQLDSAPAPIEMLPEIAAAVGAETVVMLDGGIRRGADIVKALALGARFCFVGRAALYGVAAFGEAGVARAIAILADEIDRCLGQIGAPSLAALGPGFVRR